MESKMKAICEGRMTKEEVVRESLDMYHDVFKKAERQIDTLIKVSVFHLHIGLNIMLT